MGGGEGEGVLWGAVSTYYKLIMNLKTPNREGAKNSGGKRQAQYLPLDYR